MGGWITPWGSNLGVPASHPGLPGWGAGKAQWGCIQCAALQGQGPVSLGGCWQKSIAAPWVPLSCRVGVVPRGILGVCVCVGGLQQMPCKREGGSSPLPAPGVCRSVCVSIWPALPGVPQGALSLPSLFAALQWPQRCQIKPPWAPAVSWGAVGSRGAGEGGRGVEPLSAAAPARPGQRSARRRRPPRAQRGHPRR